MDNCFNIFPEYLEKKYQTYLECLWNSLKKDMLLDIIYYIFHIYLSKDISVMAFWRNMLQLYYNMFQNIF